MSVVSDRAGRRVELSLDDCRCPVCLEIFMEPVTLPCTHTFCKECFLESVDKATLCCPLCRKRVSTWARLNSRKNTLVNQQLWTQIQTCFPLLCQRRVSGQDDNSEDDQQHTGVSLGFPRVCEPGELRQEYEDQVTKLTEEKRVLEEEERRASEEYIQRLLAEEENLLQEERRRKEEDERLARLLSDQLNSPVVSQENPRPADATPAKKKKKKEEVGQIEKFLSPRQSISSNTCNLTANKENILVSGRPLPHLEHHGADLHLNAPSASFRFANDEGASSLAKRKSPEEDEETVHKQVCHSFSSSTPSTSSSTTSSSSSTTSSSSSTTSSSSSTTSSSTMSSSSSLLQGITELEAELLSRLQQEDEDRRLALLLQKELDQEEKQRATDRRKGSTDAYPLRQHRLGREEASRRAVTPSRAFKKTTKTSSSSSSSSSFSSSSSASSSASSIRGSKQATLTEMFSGLNR